MTTKIRILKNIFGKTTLVVFFLIFFMFLSPQSVYAGIVDDYISDVGTSVGNAVIEQVGRIKLENILNSVGLNRVVDLTKEVGVENISGVLQGRLSVLREVLPNINIEDQISRVGGTILGEIFSLDSEAILEAIDVDPTLKNIGDFASIGDPIIKQIDGVKLGNILDLDGVGLDRITSLAKEVGSENIAGVLHGRIPVLREVLPNINIGDQIKQVGGDILGGVFALNSDTILNSIIDDPTLKSVVDFAVASGGGITNILGTTLALGLGEIIDSLGLENITDAISIDGGISGLINLYKGSTGGGGLLDGIIFPIGIDTFSGVIGAGGFDSLAQYVASGVTAGGAGGLVTTITSMTTSGVTSGIIGSVFSGTSGGAVASFVSEEGIGTLTSTILSSGVSGAIDAINIFGINNQCSGVNLSGVATGLGLDFVGLGTSVPVNDSGTHLLLGQISGNTETAMAYLGALCEKEIRGDVEIQNAWRATIGQLVDYTVRFITTGYNGNPLYVSNPYLYYQHVDSNVIATFIKELDESSLSLDLKKNIAKLVADKEVAYAFPDLIGAPPLGGDPGDILKDLGEGVIGDELSSYIVGENNPADIRDAAIKDLDKRRIDARNIESQKLDWGRGFLSLENCQSNLFSLNTKVTAVDRRNCQILTPGALIQEQTSLVLGSALRQMELADEVGEWVSTAAFSAFNATLSTDGILTNDNLKQNLSNGTVSDPNSDKFISRPGTIDRLFPRDTGANQASVKIPDGFIPDEGEY